jgi:uncharacterized protein (TIGR02145 family)
MKIYFFLSIAFLTGISFSQSKKEQIEILTNRVDSLHNVVNSERKINNDKTNQINSLNAKIVGLESDISNLNKKLSGLETDKKELNNQISANKTNLTAKEQELKDLRVELNGKLDSLELIRAELTKLKPAPKPVVTNNTVSQVAQTGSYKSIKIGNQTWMTSNLNVSTFRNGEAIPEAKTDEEWRRARENKQPAWCYYDNDPKNGIKYGKLYNWYAVNDPRGLAPAGWHVPSDAEWTTLEDQLGNDAGKKMKSTSGWDSYTTGGSKTCPNCDDWNAEYRRKTACHVCKDSRSVPAPTVTHSGNGTNSSSFSGLPGGARNLGGSFHGIGGNGEWWSGTEEGALGAYVRDLGHGNGHLLRSGDSKAKGLSVRCLRD